MKIKPVALILLIFLLGGCSSMSTSDKQNIVQTAIPISVQYIKQYYIADFIVTSHDIDDPSIHSRLYLYGHITGHEDERITVSYNYDTQEVLSVEGPGWFIDSRNPKKEAPSS
ncbi:MAG TPA: hypothetical protein DEF35_20360 [Paenibacillus sp.]|nr:hypothetical protein P364_0104070 [Paenibacillus sp. MAEPY2]KGP86764.1 hypothetical protein P363_0115740 [Paenibacillus sp. MAEPY1]OZQ71873.1 hypothetical protein CA599_08435 [Paenibacillus taichungensis]HBU83971.1 hypothetical protein [Paenibacillus sp.]